LVTEQELADEFEALADSHEPDLVASFLTGDLKKVLNYNEKTYSQAGLQLDWLKYLVELLEEEQISDRNAEKVLREIVEEPQNPENIVEEQDLLKSGDDEITEFVEEAIEENPDAVEDYNSGDEEAVNFLVGQVMSISQGKADPKTAREKILEEL
jgi:aspartyl-tRNA(Asn)/glutamyl-tRNA(Gln) amidotransferase subunit B